MKKLFALNILLVLSSFCFSQDIIVLRKDESEIKCRIVSINDTAIFYRKWNTPGTAKYSFKRFEVLSYTIEKSHLRLKALSEPKGGLVSTEEIKNENNKSDSPDEGILGKYYSGDVLDGYIISKNGDTINGLVYVKNVAINQYQVTFEDDLGSKKDYSPSDIKGYQYGNLTYTTVSTELKKELTNGYSSPSGVLFLHQIESGKAKLYRVFELRFPKNIHLSVPDPPTYMGNISHYYFIDNGNGAKAITKGKSLRKILTKNFSDDAVLQERLKVSSPKISDLPNIIKDYNERH